VSLNVDSLQTEETMEEPQAPEIDGNLDKPGAPFGPVTLAERAVLPFPVVGIGASAGGLEALEDFFSNTPPDSGMAYIVVQHLSPEHQSLMAEILARHTAMPVSQITDGMSVEANHVYVIAPGFTLTLGGGKLHLGEPTEKRGHRRPVDDFFRSLAEEQKRKAIVVILSGTGTNGTAGAQAIKASGGICVAQNPDSAAFPGMPSSLIHAGYADLVLEVREIPGLLLRYVSNPYVGLEPEARAAEQDLQPDRAHLREILAILRTRTRHDFSGYRKPTLFRRLQRRMGLSALTKLTDYASLLREDPKEALALANDLMINVTGFFRDPEAWEALRNSVISPLCASRQDGEPIRAWVTACASGEEAYSLAILIAEELRARGLERTEVKIFATDTADKSLALARAGVFPGGIESDLAPERIDRFFDKDEYTYRVKKEIRDMVVFAPQDVLRDPPFSRVDLVTCRNLLIYLEPETQRRVISLLHFSLRDGGYMFLGTTESFGGSEHLFEVMSKRWRIYRRTGHTQHRFTDVPTFNLRAPANAMRALEIPTGPPVKPSPTLLLQRALLERYGPPTVVVDRSDQVVYFHGATDSFLRQPAGEPTRDLLQLVRPQLRLVVRNVIRNAIRDNGAFTARAEVGEPPFPARQVEITCEPVIQGKAPEYFLVSFRLIDGRAEGGEEGSPAAKPISPEQAQREAGVIEEVEALRHELQNTVEAFEATSEELKASNEEATSINEELQSTNEELETGKEELQSVNEELTTVNSQLQTKIAQLEAMTNDLANLLGSTDIAVIFLDADFRVRRYTPAVSDLLELIESDIGRPITDLAPKFTDEHLLTDARQVLQRLIPLEREVRSRSGRWYLRRTLPYRTSENRIEGVVITFVDVGARKRAERATVMALDRGLAVLDQVPMAILLMDAKDSSLQFANRRAAQLFGASLLNPVPENQTTPAPSLEGVGNDGWRYRPEDWPLARVLATGTSITDEKIQTVGANGQQLTLSVSAAPIRDEEGNTVAFVGTFLDVTGKKDG
jgi:two-component system, chemotaxis family, CheB/CheR fusion protein